MKKIICVLAIAIVVIISILVGVKSMTITPTSLTLTTYENITQTATINLKNTNNFTIYNITFSPINYVNFSIIDKIDKNQTLTYAFNVTTQGEFSNTYSSTASFNYLSPVLQPLTSYTININTNGFTPSDLTVNQNDTIFIHNNDTITHTINIEEEQIILLPTEQRTFYFTQIKTVNYNDEVTLATGIIHVTNRTEIQPIHDNNLDETFSLTLNAQYREATLSLEVFTKNFTLNYNQIAEGVLKVETNDKPAYNVSLNAQWLSFANNNFNLNQDDYSLIFFNITPEINATNQTNKTHIIPINISSTNSQAISQDINLFINYHNFGEEPQDTNTSNTTIIFIDLSPEMLEQLCKQYPDRCPTRNVTVNISIEANKTTLEEQFDVLGDKFDRLENKIDQGDGKPAEYTELKAEVQDLEILVKDLQTWLLGDFGNIAEDWNTSMKQDEARLRGSFIRKIVFWSIFTLAVIITASILSFKIWRRRVRKRLIAGLGL